MKRQGSFAGSACLSGRTEGEVKKKRNGRNKRNHKVAIKTIMIVLSKILILFHFKAFRSNWLTVKEIVIVFIVKGTQRKYTKTNFDHSNLLEDRCPMYTHLISFR